MIREVRVNSTVFDKAHTRFGDGRSLSGRPSEYDFTTGPLAAAVFAFRGFDDLSYDLVPAVRSYTIVDPFFGPVVFAAVLSTDGVVEIVDFSDDPDYWTTIEDDPA